MDIETALDPHTRISVYAAMAELENHGHESYVMQGELYGSLEAGKFERICVVCKGEVVARRVMVWMGY